jgi:hypothetical protein
MPLDIKSAIESADIESLKRLLAEDPSRADALITWGDQSQIHTHPLHYISDLLFEGKLEKGKELPLVHALIRAGADLNFQRDGKGDTPLIGAASLGAQDVGIALIHAGANPAILGIFAETALHWAALLGEDRLASQLIAVSNPHLLNLEDGEYKSPPLGWAIHGRQNPPKGNQGKQCEVAALLVNAGAIVEPARLESAAVLSDPPMLAALRGQSAR